MAPRAPAFKGNPAAPAAPLRLANQEIGLIAQVGLKARIQTRTAPAIAQPEEVLQGVGRPRVRPGNGRLPAVVPGLHWLDAVVPRLIDMPVMHRYRDRPARRFNRPERQHQGYRLSRLERGRLVPA